MGKAGFQKNVPAEWQCLLTKKECPECLKVELLSNSYIIWQDFYAFSGIL